MQLQATQTRPAAGSIDRARALDLTLAVLWPVFAAGVMLATHLTFVPSMLLFLLVPGVYLGWRAKASTGRAVAFSAIMGVPLAIIIDYFMEVTHAWVLGESFFGDARAFDYVFIEQIPWLMMFAYLTVAFYQRFVGESDGKTLPSWPLWRLAAWHGFLFTAFVLSWAFAPDLLVFDYAYLKVGIFFGVLPVLYVVAQHRDLLRRFAGPAIYFVWFSLIYEVVSLKLGHWAFPNTSQFIGYVEVLGHSFPYEELAFWIVLGPISCLSYFELFADWTGKRTVK